MAHKFLKLATWPLHIGFAVLLQTPLLIACQGEADAEADVPWDSSPSGSSDPGPDSGDGGQPPGGKPGSAGDDAFGGKATGPSAQASSLEGLWVTAYLPADACEDARSISFPHYLRVRRNARGMLELVQLAAEVPRTSLSDSGYEACSTTLIDEGNHATATVPYFCASLAPNANGTTSTAAISKTVEVDELTLVGETLYEHRVNADHSDCEGARDFVYTRSDADTRGQLAPPVSMDVTGYWRTNRGVRPYGLYVALELQQAGSSVTGEFETTSDHGGTLTGTINGTRLVGIVEEDYGGSPQPVEFVFSADARRFAGRYGTEGTWNGAND